MKPAHTLVVTALVLAGFVGAVLANEAYRKSKQREQWMEQVVADFYDPSAAQFRSLSHSHDALCGEVNGKNRMGAYVGFKRFYSNESGARIEPDIADYLDPESIEAQRSASDRRLWQALYDANCWEQ